MAGLKIYACSGIGNAGSTFDYWLDNTKTTSNTQAVNTLLAQINLKYSEVVYLGLTPDEIVMRLNQIDYMSICLAYAQAYKDNAEELHYAGEIIGTLYKSGLFSYDSLDNTERDAHLDELFEIVARAYESDQQPNPDLDFMNWFVEKVEQRNKVGLSLQDQLAIDKTLQDAAVKGIGGYEDDPDIGKILSDAGSYFLYLFFSDEQINKFAGTSKATVERRKRYEQRTYNYCKGIFIKMYGSEAEMQAVIRANIYKEYQQTPEEVCETLVQGFLNEQNGEEQGIEGAIIWTAMAIVKLISVLLVFLLGLIKVICECVARTNEAKYQALDESIRDGGCPQPNDYSGSKFYKEAVKALEKGDPIAWGGIIAAAIGLWLLLKNRNKNK